MSLKSDKIDIGYLPSRKNGWVEFDPSRAFGVKDSTADIILPIEDNSNIAKIEIHSKIIKKAFHQTGKHAVPTTRFYYIALIHFSADGSFPVKELAAVLTEKYDYKFNSRMSLSRLNRTLQNAPVFFKQTKPGYYTFTSRRQFLGFQRSTDPSTKQDLSILSKGRNKEFTDMMICLNAVNQPLPVQDFCNQTGYNRSRMFEALRHCEKYGVERRNINCPHGSFDTEEEAEKARRDLYYKPNNEDSKNKKRIVSKVIIENGKYNVYITVGNSFTELSNQGLSCDDRDILRNMKNKARDKASRERKSKSIKQTTVYQVALDVIYKGFNSVGQEIEFLKAQFLSDEVYNKFEQRITAHAA